MASGPLLDACGDESREKRRWAAESKVYTRKIHNKGPKPNPNQNPQPPPQIQPPSSQQTLATTTTYDANYFLQQLQPPPPLPLLQEKEKTQLSYAASDGDAFSIDQKPSANNDVSNDQNRVVTINLASKTKHESRGLRKKLNSELELVRSLARKLEARQLQLSSHDAGKTPSIPGHSISKHSANDIVASFPTKKAPVILESALTAAPIPPSHRQLSVSVPAGSDGDNGIVEAEEKEKRTPKASQYYKNTYFLLGKEKLPPQESNKKSKAGRKNGMQSMENKVYEQAFKKCGVLLSKLMKHSHGWVFSSPVDPEALGLPDYHIIIKHPMDLGTVMFRLSKNWYKTPREFAEDVRLTFHNAMVYNPKGQDVHIIAEQLLQIFEEQWPVIEEDLIYLHSPPKLKKPPLPDMQKTLERSDSTAHPLDVGSKTKCLNKITHIGRLPALKKPKAKDPNKREMMFEEKQRLSDNLQILPSEKLDIVVQIIRRRNLSLSQHEDEIEVDIDSVDTETLWELDRFVTNYKKSLSKNKRKAELAILMRAETEQHSQDREQRVILDAAPEILKENKTVPVKKSLASLSPIGGPRNRENGSRSTSSSSSSSDSGSTSSDSDSESSSGYGSDGSKSP